MRIVAEHLAQHERFSFGFDTVNADAAYPSCLSLIPGFLYSALHFSNVSFHDGKRFSLLPFPSEIFAAPPVTPYTFPFRLVHP